MFIHQQSQNWLLSSGNKVCKPLWMLSWNHLSTPALENGRYSKLLEKKWTQNKLFYFTAWIPEVPTANIILCISVHFTENHLEHICVLNLYAVVRVSTEIIMAEAL